MAPLRWKLLPLALLVLVVFGFSVVASVVEAGDAPRKTAATADERELERPEKGLVELRDRPSRWLGRRVCFVVQFQSRQERWNPGMTRFGTADWVALAGWADEEFTWEREVFENPFERLFVRRASALDELMKEARTHERFEIVATVREVFLGDPWFEIERITPLFELVGEGTILHVGRARAFAEAGKWSLALEQFDRARAAPLPPLAAAEIERHVAECSFQRDQARK